MLRSAFRGKQETDSAKDENQGKSSHGRPHFFFHRDVGYDDAKNSNDHENLNALVAEAVGYSSRDEVVTTDFNNHSTHRSSSDKENVNEEDGSSKPCTSHEVHVGRVDCDQEVTHNRGGEFSSSEREIYETQLAQLQEQLFNTMIDYQDMSAQVEKLKAVDIHKLQKEIQEEREKNNELREKLKQKQKSSSSKLQRKNASRIDPRSRSCHQGTDPEGDHGDDWVHLGREDEPVHSSMHVTNGRQGAHPEENQETYEMRDGNCHARDQLEEQAALESVDRESHRVQQVKTKLEMWRAKAVDMLVDRLWDFINDEPEDTDEEDGEGDPLAIKTLKENINRFSAGIKPITGFIKSVGKVLTWSNPTASFLIFMVYMYSVWYGYLLSLILFTMIWKLFMNYLHAKGIARYLGFTDKLKEETSPPEDHSWSDKFQLVLQVARKVQNTLGKMANSIEKVKNLLTWQHPVATRKLFTVLSIAFVASLGLKGPTLFMLIGLSFGIKLFIVNPIYHRFPKVKRRYDGTAKLWEELPTEADLVVSQNVVDGSQENLGRSTSATSLSSPSGSSSEHHISPHSNPMAEKFRLPSSETVLPGWEEGKRCALLDKDKPFSSVKHGKLFLTQSYLCFEKTRSSSGKQIVIKLDTVISFNKAKPIAIMPGTGMALEFNVRGVEKPYIFGAIIGRDDVFESIKATGRAGNLPWA